MFLKNSTLDVWLVLAAPPHIKHISRITCRINLKFSVSIFYLFERQKYKIQKFFIFENCPATPPQKKEYFLTNFIGKVIISFDITLFDNIYLNHNVLHFLSTIWNIWALIYVQSHFHHIWTFDGIIKFLSHVSYVTSLIVSTQSTSLPSFTLIGLLFPEIWGSGVASTNQTARKELFTKIVHSLNPSTIFVQKPPS